MEARFFVNGFPIFQSSTGPWKTYPTINYWMKNGSNEIGFQIDRVASKEEVLAAEIKGVDSPYLSFQVGVGAVGTFPADSAEPRIASSSWEPGSALQNFISPDIDTGWERWAWEDSPIIENPQEEANEIWEYVAKIERALKEKNVDSLMGYCDLRIREIAASMGSDPNEIRSQIRQLFLLFFSAPDWNVHPVSIETHELELLSNDRVIQVKGKDCPQAFRSSENVDDGNWGMLLFLSKIHGEWSWVR